MSRWPRRTPRSPGSAAAAGLADLRTTTARALRRSVTLGWDDAVRAAGSVVDALVRDGRLVRAGDRVTLPGTTTAAPDPALAAAMDRLESALAVAAPPALADAARAAGCPPEGVRALERDGRIVVLEPTLAYAAGTYATLTAQALSLATAAPLTPSALRDATGTSRRYVMAILEDLDRRGILRRTPDGHRPGPRAAGRPPRPRPDDDRRDRARRRPVVALRPRQARRAGRRRPDAGASRRRRGRHRGRGAGRGRSGGGPADPGWRPPVDDARAFEGPLAGVDAGLAATDAEVVLVVGGDMPSLVPAVLRRLVDALEDPSVDAAVLEAGGRHRPLPMALRRSPAIAVTATLLASDERRLRALRDGLALAVIPDAVWQLDDPGGATLRDVDRPEDLAGRVVDRGTEARHDSRTHDDPRWRAEVDRVSEGGGPLLREDQPRYG